jgi:prolipoprotein diacylglyceryltransferase
MEDQRQEKTITGECSTTNGEPGLELPTWLSPFNSTTFISLQNTIGNEALNLLLQGNVVQHRQNGNGNRHKPAKALIVDDDAQQLEPGQMRKTEFLDQLKSSVCGAAEEMFRNTMWSPMGCPYIDRWFGAYAGRSAPYLERALRKFANEGSHITSANDYIPLVTERVRRGLAHWADTGELIGEPEQFAPDGMRGVPANRRSLNAFQACGFAGVTLASGLALSLAWYLGLSYWVVIAVILTAVLTFLSLTVLVQACTGQPRLTYYRYFVITLGVLAALLLLLGQPLLPYLDIAVLGIGLFVACGRIGCYLIGCCHGRPHKWGVRYRKENAARDFPEDLVGIRLFPVQAMESIWVLGVVVFGTSEMIAGRPAGLALSTYVVMYALGRFCFEFLRGDRRRHYLFGVSEAQWTSVLMTLVIAVAEWYGALPTN